MATISSTQRAALAAVVADWDALDQNERTRWGKPFTGFADFRGRPETLYALKRAGLVETETAEVVTESLRRGAYGRWIGGTKKQHDVALYARPTQLGRDFVAQPKEPTS